MPSGNTSNGVPFVTIGIVGCSSPGAALCFQTICNEASVMRQENEGEAAASIHVAKHAHPHIVMDVPSLSLYVDALENKNNSDRCGTEDVDEDWASVGQLMVDSAQRLKAMGAAFVICPDNTIHQGLAAHKKKASGQSNVPCEWLHIVDAVYNAALPLADSISNAQNNMDERRTLRLGLLGTKWLVGSSMYDDRLKELELAQQQDNSKKPRVTIELVRPTSTELDEIHRIIMEELGVHRIVPSSVAYFEKVIQRMSSPSADGQRPIDAVILGCTEIPLIVSDENSSVPTLDSTRLLAKAALRKSHAMFVDKQ